MADVSFYERAAGFSNREARTLQKANRPKIFVNEP